MDRTAIYRDLELLVEEHAELLRATATELMPMYVAAEKSGDYSRVDEAKRNALERQALLADAFAATTVSLLRLKARD